MLPYQLTGKKRNVVRRFNFSHMLGLSSLGLTTACLAVADNINWLCCNNARLNNKNGVLMNNSLLEGSNDHLA